MYTSACLIYELFRSIDSEHKYHTKIRVKSTYHSNVVLSIQIYKEHFELIFDLSENEGYIKRYDGELMWIGDKVDLFIYFGEISKECKKIFNK